MASNTRFEDSVFNFCAAKQIPSGDDSDKDLMI